MAVPGGGTKKVKRSYLTVTTLHPRNVLIKDVRINWSVYKPFHHLKTLYSISKLNRPKVQPYIDALEAAEYEDHYTHLADWNIHLIKELCIQLDVDMTRFRRASDIWANELRILGDEYFKGSPEDHLYALLKGVGATEYLSGPSWRSYAPNLEKVLAEHGITLQEVK